MESADIFIVLFGAAGFLIVVAIIVSGAYRVGFASGVVAERARRDGLELRIGRKIEAAAREDASLWGTELDV